LSFKTKYIAFLDCGYSGWNFAVWEISGKLHKNEKTESAKTNLENEMVICTEIHVSICERL
jgi:hypothetical protein